MDKEYGTQKSSTKQNDTSPEYQETFWFEIPVRIIIIFIVIKDDFYGIIFLSLSLPALTSLRFSLFQMRTHKTVFEEYGFEMQDHGQGSPEG